MKRSLKTSLLATFASFAAVVGVFVGAGIAPAGAAPSPSGTPRAKAVIKDGNNVSRGTILVTESTAPGGTYVDHRIDVTGTVSAPLSVLSAGTHSLNLWEGTCSSRTQHLDLAGNSHPQHTGDLPDVNVVDMGDGTGRATIRLTKVTNRFGLSSQSSRLNAWDAFGAWGPPTTVSVAFDGLAAPTVGVYEMDFADADPNQIAPVLAAGGVPVPLSDVGAANLAGLSVLFADNGNNGGYGAEYVSHLAEIDAAVQAGMVLIIHDRYVDAAETILPGGGAFNVVRDFADDANIDVINGSTLVTNGPGGPVDNTTLDGGGSSSHGFTIAGSVPAGSVQILSQGDPTHLVTFAYPRGSGWVIYSTIPLDYYLGGNNPAAFRTVYAPNVVAYGLALHGGGGGLCGELHCDAGGCVEGGL